MSDLHGVLSRAALALAVACVSTSSFAMGDIERIGRGAVKAAVTPFVPPVAPPKIVEKKVNDLIEKPLKGLGTVAAPAFVPPVVPPKIVEQEVGKVFHKPLEIPKRFASDVIKGVDHLGKETWKVVSRPFVETGKFFQDPWGLKKKAEDLKKKGEDMLKGLGTTLEMAIFYGVAALFVLILFCAFVSTIFSRIFSRKPQIVVIARPA